MIRCRPLSKERLPMLRGALSIGSYYMPSTTTPLLQSIRQASGYQGSFSSTTLLLGNTRLLLIFRHPISQRPSGRSAPSGASPTRPSLCTIRSRVKVEPFQTWSHSISSCGNTRSSWPGRATSLLLEKGNLIRLIMCRCRVCYIFRGGNKANNTSAYGSTQP